MAASEAPDASYTVFIRLPFPRGDFVDPPAVDWDATKDAALWKILSKASKNNDIDWNALAEKFDVALPFILQQAAWLYERQLSQVKAHMRRVGASKSSAQSPVPGTDNAAGEAMRRTGSGGGGPRAPSSLAGRKDSPIPRNDGSISNIPVAPPLSRTSSANTIQNRPFPQASPRPTKATLHRLSISPPTNVRSTPPPLGHGPTALSKSKNISPSEAAESSSSDSSSDSESAQSRLIRRPPRFQPHREGRKADKDDDDDDDAPAFLPFSTSGGPQSTQTDPSATLRGDPLQINRRTTPKKSTEVIQQSQTSDSSTSSTTLATKPVLRIPSHQQRPVGPLSPRRTAELAGRSPIGRGKNGGREGSDGTPSMGSSFSDLDDASVTQSALEEALASNLQKGGMASRMSTISQALRSRYL